MSTKHPKIIKDVRGKGLMVGLEFQDFSQTRNQKFTSNTFNDRNLVLDNSITRVVEQSFPEFRQNTVNIVQPQMAAQPAPSLEPALPLLALGGPVMARVA